MIKEEHILYKALIERDKAYDGHIYFGVTSTGIYCRPTCPAKKPKPENVLFFPRAKDAAYAGFRACKRCRPESRPGSPAWQGTEVTVTKALRIIASGLIEDTPVKVLANTLGISDRHLRRLFHQYINKSPLEVIMEQRLNIAKNLLLAGQDTITDIAFASGFTSLRRFNDSFKKATGTAPGRWRKEHRHENFDH